VLDVSFNLLTQFPDDWILLYHLVELNLAGNLLRLLPKDINKMRSLARLDVSDNYIDQLPDKLAKVASLRYLNIANNCIMHWPTNFVKLQAKVQVSLSVLAVIVSSIAVINSRLHSGYCLLTAVTCLCCLDCVSMFYVLIVENLPFRFCFNVFTEGGGLLCFILSDKFVHSYYALRLILLPWIKK